MEAILGIIGIKLGNNKKLVFFEHNWLKPRLIHWEEVGRPCLC